MIKMDNLSRPTMMRVCHSPRLDDNQVRSLFEYALKKKRAQWHSARLQQEWKDAHPVAPRAMSTKEAQIDYSLHINYNE